MHVLLQLVLTFDPHWKRVHCIIIALYFDLYGQLQCTVFRIVQRKHPPPFLLIWWVSLYTARRLLVLTSDFSPVNSKCPWVFIQDNTASCFDLNVAVLSTLSLFVFTLLCLFVSSETKELVPVPGCILSCSLSPHPTLGRAAHLFPSGPLHYYCIIL